MRSLEECLAAPDDDDEDEDGREEILSGDPDLELPAEVRRVGTGLFEDTCFRWYTCLYLRFSSSSFFLGLIRVLLPGPDLVKK